MSADFFLLVWGVIILAALLLMLAVAHFEQRYQHKRLERRVNALRTEIQKARRIRHERTSPGMVRVDPGRPLFERTSTDSSPAIPAVEPIEPTTSPATKPVDSGRTDTTLVPRIEPTRGRHSAT